MKSKKRLGLIDDDSDEDEDSEDTETTEPTETPDPTAEPEPTQAPAPTETPDDGSGDTSTPTDDTIDAAEGYIGQSMDALIGSLGSPQYDEYEEEPDTKERQVIIIIPTLPYQLPLMRMEMRLLPESGKTLL